MKTVSMSGSLRENVGKKDAKALRNAGNIPCVVYGGEKQLHISIPEKQFKPLIFTPEIAFVEIKVGEEVHTAILQDVHYHPVSDNILHADFLELVEGKAIVMPVPVKVVGNSVGVIKGGKSQIKLRTLKVKSLPADMPESITCDITNLEIGQSIKVKQVELENAETLDNPNSVVVAVRITRAAASAKMAEGDEGAEGEEEAASTEE